MVLFVSLHKVKIIKEREIFILSTIYYNIITYKHHKGLMLNIMITKMFTFMPTLPVGNK